MTELRVRELGSRFRVRELSQGLGRKVTIRRILATYVP